MDIGVIRECWNEGDIVVGSNTNDVHIAGGVIGQCSTSADATVYGCFNLGDVTSFMTSQVDYVGGICGLSCSLVSACYNRGNITLRSKSTLVPRCGGIVGTAGKPEGRSCIIENCYNVGRIEVTKGENEKGVGRGSITGFTCEENILRNNFCYIYDDLTGMGEKYLGGSGAVENFNEYTDIDELKNIADKLGADYKKDTKNINKGFPILAWQDK